MMNELANKKIKELVNLLEKKEISCRELMKAYLERIEKFDPFLESFISLYEEEKLLDLARESDKRRSKNKGKSPIDGIPIAVKDNIHSTGAATTCGSRILEGYMPPYDAAAVLNIKDNGGIIIGKTNLDEFAMGSTCENSSLKRTKNPWDPNRVPGGSSGGSAAAVSSGMAPLALGSDTGGSIRQPASFCGIAGLKPTYGLVSRFGLVAYASSLDQIGPLSRDVYGCAFLLNIISGYDKNDSTSLDIKKRDYTERLGEDIKGTRIAVFTELFKEGISEQIRSQFENSLEILKNSGAVIEEVPFTFIKYIISTYYFIATAEACSNLSRYDGVKYGFRGGRQGSYREMLLDTRSRGFGKEVKKRILLGNFVLSSGYYDEYYLKAQKVRACVMDELKAVFESYDIIAMPAAPDIAFPFGESREDPMKVYLSDITTVIPNLAGLPAVSIPCGIVNDMPVGLQLIGKPFGEDRLLQAAYSFEVSQGCEFAPPVEKIFEERNFEKSIFQGNDKIQKKESPVIYTMEEKKIIDIENLIKLASFEINEAEKKHLRNELEDFLGYAGVINNAPCRDVKPARHSAHREPGLRKDEIKVWNKMDSLLDNAAAIQGTGYLIPPLGGIAEDEEIVPEQKKQRRAEYEAVIGLEVHAQLKTRTKLFCGCSTQFGREPNSSTCPVCSGQPGVLPVINEEAVDKAVLLGLAAGSTINRESVFVRKNFFYPDLPKGYQISQFEEPLCRGGSIEIELNGRPKKVMLNRIHIEEDTGKMVHIGAPGIRGSRASVLDFNRAGNPLLEIVTEPVLSTPEEAREYVTILRAILVSLDICDGNMEEGSLRCDANVSVRAAGDKGLGAKNEIKNMNSLKAIERALEYEINRIMKLERMGVAISRETRLWEESSQKTYLMRSKEESHDYRYFPEPDLLPLKLSSDGIESAGKNLPPMPLERKSRYESEFFLNRDEARFFMINPEYANFFEKTLEIYNKPRIAANWFLNEILYYVKDKIENLHIKPDDLAEFLKRINRGDISGKIGKGIVKNAFSQKRGLIEILDQEPLTRITDPAVIEKIIDKILKKNESLAAEYRGGKKKVMQYVIGQVMKETGGMSKPEIINDILKRKLDKT